MAKSIAENAKIDFVIKLNGLKTMKGFNSDDELAKFLDCSRRTISNMRSDPFSVSGKYILMVQGYFDKENERRR